MANPVTTVEELADALVDLLAAAASTSDQLVPRAAMVRDTERLVVNVRSQPTLAAAINVALGEFDPALVVEASGVRDVVPRRVAGLQRGLTTETGLIILSHFASTNLGTSEKNYDTLQEAYEGTVAIQERTQAVAEGGDASTYDERQARLDAFLKMEEENPRTIFVDEENARAYKPEGGIFKEIGVDGEFIEGGAVAHQIGNGNWVIEEVGLPEDQPEDFLGYLGQYPEYYAVENPRYRDYEAAKDRFGDTLTATKFAALLGDDVARLPSESLTPIYGPRDHQSMFATKSPTYIAQVQRALNSAGYLDDGYVEGVWDEDSWDGMYAAMDEANSKGATWEETARRRAEALANLTDEERLARAGRAPFIAPAYRAPDYASLASSVRQVFSSQLGRPPTDAEMASLADRMNRDYRSAYSADVAASRSEYEAGNRAILDDSMYESGGSVTSVDPLARLEKNFLDKYGPTVERTESVLTQSRNVSLMMNQLAGLEQMVGG